jgi:hypothetical protein
MIRFKKAAIELLFYFGVLLVMFTDQFFDD